MNSRSKQIVLIIVAIVILAAIIVIASLNGRSSPAQKQNPTQALHFTKINTGNLPAGAPLGAVSVDGLPSSFPKGLALDTGAVMTVLNGMPSAGTSSYTAPQGEYTVTWTETSSISSLFTTYKSYFAGHGWTVIRATTTSAFAYVQAALASSTALVDLMPQDGNTRIYVDYNSQ